MEPRLLKKPQSNIHIVPSVYDIIIISSDRHSLRYYKQYLIDGCEYFRSISDRLEYRIGVRLAFHSAIIQLLLITLDPLHAHLPPKFTHGNVLSALQLADVVRSQKLRTEAIDYISSNTEGLMLFHGWSTLYI